MFGILSIVFAILALSFLIFIHELGHYWMARRVGMRVETFSIGFGKPIYSWQRGETKWQIGWLLFGGYVKIAGMDGDGEEDPYSVPDGFFGKRPIDRIKVAFMGPFVNLVFALLVFTIIWAMGGRIKGFQEFTHKLGWVHPESELYQEGIRPGDEIVAYGDQEFESQMDHRRIPLTSSSPINVHGYKVNYKTGKKKPFTLKVDLYPDPNDYRDEVVTTGIAGSAEYLIYDKLPGSRENPLLEGSPMEESGIQYGDRLIWMDGELIFSQFQLSKLINDRRALLTIDRNGEKMLRRVPRIQVAELRPDMEFREELIDWQYEAKLMDRNFQDLYTIPYNISSDLVVENELKFIDKDAQKEAYPENPYSELDRPLKQGDKVIAIEGIPVKQPSTLLKELQVNRVNLIVQRPKNDFDVIPWNQAEQAFDRQIHPQDIEKIAKSIGTDNPVRSSGNYVLLKPITPKAQSELVLTPESQSMMAKGMVEQKKRIESIEDPEKRAWALSQLDKQQKRLLLGVILQDRQVRYNPDPTSQFYNVFEEIWQNLSALVTGAISPKYFIGPVGIVQHVQVTTMVSYMEAFFWIGVISLNLGILNLLPIPVLDGGTILINLYELTTGRRLHPKTLEKLILPFVLLLLGFFIYLTYNDLLRIFGMFAG